MKIVFRVIGSVLILAAGFAVFAQSVAEFKKILTSGTSRRWVLNRKSLSLGACTEGEIVYHFDSTGRVKKRTCQSGNWKDQMGSWSIGPDPLVRSDMRLSMFGETYRLTYWRKTKTNPELVILTKPDPQKVGATTTDNLYPVK